MEGATGRSSFMPAKDGGREAHFSGWASTGMPADRPFESGAALRARLVLGPMSTRKADAAFGTLRLQPNKEQA